MKKLLLTTSMLFLCLFFLHSQEGNWEWARLFQSAGAIVTDSWGMDICMDANNNVYIMGVFRAVPLTIGTETLTNRGNYDIRPFHEGPVSLHGPLSFPIFLRP